MEIALGTPGEGELNRSFLGNDWRDAGSGRVRFGAVFCVFLVFGAVGYLGWRQISYSFSLGHALSPRADRGSENDAVNSAVRYSRDGFLKFAGLPNRALLADNRGPYLFPDEEPPHPQIYTHYPPGPNWIAGLAMKVFGPMRMPYYRLIPITMSLFALLVLYHALTVRLGIWRATPILLVTCAIPMTSEMMHGLHFHGYAFLLLVLQLAVVIRGSREPLWGKVYLKLAILGFLQGWFSFDYCFIATFAALPFIASASSLNLRDRWKRGVYSSIASGGGFVVAHLLHLVQVAIYLRSFREAYEELGRAGAYRAAGGSATGLYGLDGLVMIARRYFLDLGPKEAQFGMLFWIIPGAFALAAVLSLISTRFGHSWRLKIRIGWPELVAVASAFVISVLWISIMQGHASEPGHFTFLPRHFFLFIFVCCYLSVTSFVVERKPVDTGQ